MYKRINLDNGINIILNHMPHMESAAVGVWVAAGSRNEDEYTSGISHFLEHMTFKGTPTRNSRRIKEEIEGRGGSLNGFTSEEMTCYLAKVSGEHVEMAINVLSDMVLYAHIKEKDMARERTVIIEEIKMYQDLPNHHVHDILNELMWPGHSLGLSVAGDIKSVSSITRQDIINYKKANYIPKKILLVLCGDLKEDALIRRINKIFSLSVDRGPAPIIKFDKVQTKPQVKILHKGTQQSHLSMGFHTFGRIHKDRYALSLLHIILGANMSSRLFENVREKKGLAYEISTEIKRFQETGAFVVNAGIEHKKVRETAALIIKELKKIKDKAVSQKELKRAKEFFKGQLLLALENTLEHMLWLGEHVISSGRLPDKNKIIKKAESVTAYDLERVASGIFNSKNVSLALIGPVEDRVKREIEIELSL